MRPIVYLAGPITGLSFSQVNEWRETTKKILVPRGIDCASPMRGQQHLSNETAIMHSYIGNPFTSPRGIMRQDHYDVCRSTVILVNFLGAPKQSAGTIMEIGWAWDKHKPVVVIMEESGNPHDGHPMILECISFRCSDLTVGIGIVERLVSTE